MAISKQERTRRRVIREGLSGCLAMSAGPWLSACHNSSSNDRQNQSGSNMSHNLGPLAAEPDENGLRLPEGFSSRVVATTDTEPAASSAYKWHDLPDGGATFRLPAGGWVYVSNSEANSGQGGVGALEFDANGDPVDAYQLLSGTTRNCAGGPTPWDTWLSCEEYASGTVWETYPLEKGARPAVQRPALGVFSHEAAAVDPVTGIVYLTEDAGNGCLYRFLPDSTDDLSSGRLQAAKVDVVDADNRAQEGMVTWVDVADPTAATTSVRVQAQAAGASIFVRGEGCWWHNGILYMTTTGDGLVWSFTPGADGNGPISQIYNRTSLYPADTSLNRIDNITVSSAGDVLVAEDTDDMQIQVITPDGLLFPLLQVIGHTISTFPGEIAGPAFDSSGTRLYFSSQRGTQTDFDAAGKYIGVTYEVSGPFVV